MTGRRDFRIRRTLPADPEVVFAILADGAGWSSWAKPMVATSRWEREGATEVGGVGAIRAIGRWPFLILEEITEYEPPSRLSYRYVGRLLPVRNYQATVEFAKNARGDTDLTWSASFINLIPGPAVPWAISSSVRFVAGRLGRESAKRARSAG
jgi:uncharacterized protein YndB with AHSA1/START domain